MSAKERYLATMLLECILSGDLSYAEELLNIGADPNFVLEEGATPLHVAVSIEDEVLSEQFTRLLLQLGGDPNSRSSEGGTPLHAAAAFGRANNVRLLLENGGDPDLLDQDGMTVEDNIKASESEMCKIYLILHRQKQSDKNKHSAPQALHEKQLCQQHVKFASYQQLSEDEDTLPSAWSKSSPQHNVEGSTDNSTVNYTEQLIQMIQDIYDPRFHQIDVTSPDHPLLVPKMSDDTIVHGCSKSSSSDESYHTCENSDMDESSGKGHQKQLFMKSVHGNHLTSKPVHYCSGTAKDSSLDLSETIPLSDNETFSCDMSSTVTPKARQHVMSTVPEEDSFDFDSVELQHISLGVDADSTIKSDVTDSLAKLSLLAEDRSDAGRFKPRVTGSQQSGSGFVSNSPSFDSGLPSSWCDVYVYPKTSSRNPSIISANGSQLSRHSQTSTASSVCSCSTVKVEKYIDSEVGSCLIETHLIPQKGDVIYDADCSIHSHNVVAVSDWLDVSTLSLDGAGNHNDVIIPQQMAALSNSAIRAKLVQLEDNPGPVTDSTRNVYLKRLVQLESDPELARRNASNSVPGFLPEIQQALAEDLDLSTSSVINLEFEMCKPFIDHDPKNTWREGSKKCCFNYFLLDPRVTQNLPVRAKLMNPGEAFECFLRSIFYIGKGVRSRPYAHFKEAMRYMVKVSDIKKMPGAKIAHILDIWQANLGVISLHVFQNVIPCEAYTREACMIEALGLYRLTNKIAGKHYGPASTWPIKKRRTLGVLLLKKAFRIFLSEGERQIRPYDVKI